MPLSDPQRGVAESEARFRVLIAGRRFGKTFFARRELARFGRIPKRKAWYIAPTYRMAKEIMWGPLKERLTELRWLDGKPNETDLSAVLKCGSVIALRGADNPDSLRGSGLDFVVFDEFADIKPSAWFEVVRPMLADRGGHALFIGTPKGRNWAYDLYLKGLNGAEAGWRSWHFTTIEGGNVPPEEVEAARRELDELTFQQEFEASFVNFEGRAYYPFAIETHCAPLAYDPRAPLIFCFDFNVAPGVAAICQEQALPNGLSGTGVIGEVYIPRNSNTPAVCRKLLADWGQHQGRVTCYGDATGGARGSAKVDGSDWDLIRREFRASPLRDRVAFRVPSANPPERSRLNAMNSRLKSQSGEIRLMVDPAKAPHVVKDLEGVALLKGGSGEMDKNADPALTHMCFAAGTVVDLGDGPTPIENVSESGTVRTWDGSFVPYSSAGKTLCGADIVSVCISDWTVVYSTPWHQWLTTEGWVCAAELTGKTLAGWRSGLSRLPSKNSTAKDSTVTTGKKDISGGQVGEGSNTCTALYGCSTTAISSQDTIYITSMEIDQTTNHQILSLSRLKSIINCITRLIKRHGNWLERLGYARQGMQRKNGIRARKEGRGIGGITRMLLKNSTRGPESLSAYGARSLLWLARKGLCFAVEIAKLGIDITRKLTTNKEFVRTVGSNLKQTSMHQQHIAAGSVAPQLTVKSVQRAGKADVYCLFVPSSGCFCLGNGAIVSNSDALGYYIVGEFPTTVRSARSTEILL